MVDEVVGKIGAKTADYATQRSHEVKSRGRAAIPLVDSDETPPIVMSVESFDALERKVTRDGNPTMSLIVLQKRAVFTHSSFTPQPAKVSPYPSAVASFSR